MTTEESLESLQLQQCSALLNRLKRNSNAGPFLQPVDPIALGIPDYFEKIKNPIDMGTIKEKLANKQYKKAEEFDADMQLMFSNCFEYNAPGTPVHEIGKNLKSVYDGLFRQVRENRRPAPVRTSARIIRELPAQGLLPEETNLCADIINSLSKVKHRKCNWPFLTPVKEEEAPGYFSIINEPMDLSTARSKLDSGAYRTVTEFISDILLIFKNCRVYNAEGTEVYRCGQELEKVAVGLLGKHFENELRTVELRSKLEESRQELERLEAEASGGMERVFGMEHRERIAELFMDLDREQAERVAEIVYKHKAYNYIDNEELEVNLYTLSDKVLGEIKDYIDTLSDTPA